VPTRIRRRAGAFRVLGRRRCGYLAWRIGVGLRESRLALGFTQAEAAHRAGVSQGFWSLVERGEGTVASLETLASCAAAVSVQLAAFVEAMPGASLPQDIEHLRRQQLVVATASRGGWTSRPERQIDPAARRSRSIDVHLERRDRLEIAVVEIEDLLADGGGVMRGLGDKTAAIRREFTEQRISVQGLLIVRATRRNRALVTELGDLFATRFPASSGAWLAALGDPKVSMPREDGFLWSSVDGTRLFAARLGSCQPARRATSSRVSGSSHGLTPEAALARR
jgi:transcriptional regulator with XRE-family HTH domain